MRHGERPMARAQMTNVDENEADSGIPGRGTPDTGWMEELT